MNPPNVNRYGKLRQKPCAIKTKLYPLKFKWRRKRTTKRCEQHVGQTWSSSQTIKIHPTHTKPRKKRPQRLVSQRNRHWNTLFCDMNTWSVKLRDILRLIYANNLTKYETGNISILNTYFQLINNNPVEIWIIYTFMAMQTLPRNYYYPLTGYRRKGAAGRNSDRRRRPTHYLI